MIHKWEDDLQKNIRPLINKELFKNNSNEIAIPFNPFTESNLQNMLCYSLRESNPWLETPLGNGKERLDILITPERLFGLGIECKKSFDRIDEKQLKK